MDKPISVYIHIPFCKTRCNYCDFNTFTGMESFIAPYLASVKEEIRNCVISMEINQPVHSIYLGGGTPSLLSPEQIRELIQTVRDHFFVTRDAEITMEMNPGDLLPEKTMKLRSTGVNRVSLGMQSANNEELKCMGRRHSVEQTLDTYHRLREAGFDNINLDLIFGYPGQTMESWRYSLEKAMELEPDHISLYALSVEKGTPLESQILSGSLKALPDDTIADMYDSACEMMKEHRYIHYEISNWSRTHQTESRHNKQYWYIEPYLGFGSGAHSYFSHVRIKNVSSIEEYIERINFNRPWENTYPAAEEIIALSELTEMKDVVIFGLRLLQEGVNPTKFKERFGLNLEDIFHYQLKKLLANGYVYYNQEGNLVLNEKYAFVSNQIFLQFV